MPHNVAPGGWKTPLSDIWSAFRRIRFHVHSLTGSALPSLQRIDSGFSGPFWMHRIALYRNLLRQVMYPLPCLPCLPGPPCPRPLRLLDYFTYLADTPIPGWLPDSMLLVRKGVSKVHLSSEWWNGTSSGILCRREIDVAGGGEIIACRHVGGSLEKDKKRQGRAAGPPTGLAVHSPSLQNFLQSFD